MTCTVVEWLAVFTRSETLQIILNSWQYQRQHAGLKLYGYVILENHLHFIAQAPELNKCVAGFKAYTARQIIDYLQQQKADRLLQRLHFAKAVQKRDREYQFRQEGVHAYIDIPSGLSLPKPDAAEAGLQSTLTR